MSSPPPDSDAAIQDVELIARLRDDDQAALNILVRRYGPPLIGYAARTIGSADRAEEVVQEMFFQLWNGRAKLDLRQDIAAYLFWLTRRRALDAARADRLAAQRDGRWITDVAGEAAALNAGEAAINAEEVRAELWAALSDVPPRCREIFMLVWDRQLPYAEVGRILGIAVPTVKNQMSRALKRLIEVLGEKGHG